MSPITFRPTVAAGFTYANPFSGDTDSSTAIDVNLTGLTTAEVDTNGVLKPGIPLTRAGTLVGATQTRSTPGAATAGGSNVGNGTIGTISGEYGAPAETVTVTFTDATHFNVDGSQSGHIGSGVAGTPFASEVINFTFTAGGTPMAAGDKFTFTVTSGTSDYVYGITAEALKVANSNSTGDLAAAGTSGVVNVAVVIRGSVRREVAEDNLGRAYTANELAGFIRPGCHMALIGGALAAES